MPTANQYEQWADTLDSYVEQIASKLGSEPLGVGGLDPAVIQGGRVPAEIDGMASEVVGALGAAQADAEQLAQECRRRAMECRAHQAMVGSWQAELDKHLADEFGEPFTKPYPKPAASWMEIR